MVDQAADDLRELRIRAEERPSEHRAVRIFPMLLKFAIFRLEPMAASPRDERGRPIPYHYEWDNNRASVTYYERELGPPARWTMLYVYQLARELIHRGIDPERLSYLPISILDVCRFAGLSTGENSQQQIRDHLHTAQVTIVDLDIVRISDLV